MKQIRISDAELVLMEHIWEKEGIRAVQLVQLEKPKWAGVGIPHTRC